MDDNVTVIEVVARVTDETQAGADSAAQTVSKLEQAMKKAQNEIDKMRKMSKIELTMYAVDKASKVINGVLSTGKRIAGKVWNVTVKAVDLVTAPVRGIMKMLTNPIMAAAGFAGIGLGVGDIVNTFSDFEQAMANVRSVSGATAGEMQQLTQAAKDLGASTSFSAKEVAEGMYYLGQAGWKTNDIIAAMPGLLNLAAADDVELATATDILSSAMSAFGIEAQDAGRAADVFAATASASQTGVTSLGESFKYIAPLAGALGYSIEDISVALGLMANQSISGSTAGTSLRATLARMSGQADETGEDTSKVAVAMKKLGLSMTDNEGKTKPFLTILEDMRTGFSGLTETEKSAYAAMLAGQNAMSGILALVNASDEDFAEMTKAIYESAGAARGMADIRMDTFKGAIEGLGGAVETLKINIGERLAPYLRGFTAWLTGKMPAIETAVGEALDYIEGKLKGVQKAVQTMVQSPEWKNAETLWDKVKVAWNKLVAEPFDAWWNGPGKAWLAEKAGAIGKGLGTALKAGITALLGFDAGDTAADGASIGKSFADGFLEGFDGKKVADAIFNAIKGFIADHPVISTLAIGGTAVKTASKGFQLAGAAQETFGTAKDIWRALFGGKTTAAGTGTAARAAAEVAAPAVKAAGGGVLTKLGTEAFLNLGVLGEAMGSGATSIGGLAAAGGASVAGIGLGIAGLVSAVSDLAEASKTDDPGVKFEKRVTAGVKTGMVGAGAGIGAVIGSVVPVLGTLWGRRLARV
jgi:TP901 family phage tail tape measure protein